MEENKKSNNKIIVIVLAVLLLGILGYTIYNNSEHKKVTDAIEEEKLEIEGNLDNMIVKYEEAIGQNTSMSNELSIERDRIIALRDSIKGLKATNYSLIRRYRGQIAKLEETNRRLFFMTDSLTGVNQLLSKDLDSANVKISSQLAQNDTLSLQNLQLSEKVAIGSILKVSTLKYWQCVNVQMESWLKPLEREILMHLELTLPLLKMKFQNKVNAKFTFK